jgi:protein-S-isoprenylcysteine O-methyltransferase Ste14
LKGHFVFHPNNQAQIMTLNQFLFRNRSYTPLPFLLLMAIYAQPTWISMLAGFLVLCSGEFLRAWGVFYVGSETRVTHEVGASKLVTSGAFAHVRNPLYLGNILIYTGAGIMSNALTPWIQLAGLLYFIFQYTLIVKEEERFLRNEFGKEYSDYCTNVPRFLFKLSPYQNSRKHRIDWQAGWASEMRSLQAILLVLIILVTLWLLR